MFTCDVAMCEAFSHPDVAILALYPNMIKKKCNGYDWKTLLSTIFSNAKYLAILLLCANAFIFLIVHVISTVFNFCIQVYVYVISRISILSLFICLCIILPLHEYGNLFAPLVFFSSIGFIIFYSVEFVVELNIINLFRNTKNGENVSLVK